MNKFSGCYTMLVMHGEASQQASRSRRWIARFASICDCTAKTCEPHEDDTSWPPDADCQCGRPARMNLEMMSELTLSHVDDHLEGSKVTLEATCMHSASARCARIDVPTRLEIDTTHRTSKVDLSTPHADAGTVMIQFARSLSSSAIPALVTAFLNSALVPSCWNVLNTRLSTCHGPFKVHIFQDQDLI